MHFTGGKEFAYVLFPRPDTADAVKAKPRVDQLYVDSRGRVVAKVFSGITNIDGGLPIQTQVTYFFDRELDCVAAEINDGFGQAHSWHFRDGSLDHRVTEREKAQLKRTAKLPTAPDGNAPEVLELFTDACASKEP